MNTELQKSLIQFRRKIVAIYLLSLFVLLGLALFANQVLETQAAQLATSFVKPMVQIGDLRQTIITLSQAKLDYFNSVAYYDQSGKFVFSLPAFLKNNNSTVTPNEFLLDSVKVPVMVGQHDELGSLIFVYGRYRYFPQACALWLLLVLSTLPIMVSSKKDLIRRVEKDTKIKTELARAELAKKVRHDIRSPLISLQALFASSKSLDLGERQMLDGIISRIFGIISDLSDSNERSIENENQYSVETLVKEVVREKKLRIQGRIQLECIFQPSSFLAYTSLGRLQFSRILSNVIDNSIEAINGTGFIQLGLRVALGMIVLDIVDSGKGIPPNVLPHIFDEEYTFGKPGGSGLGLSSAKKVLESHGGSITASTELGLGTKVRIEVPIENRPAWWLDRIELANTNQVVIVDDQKTSHDAWTMKLRGLTPIIHLDSESSLESWLKKNDSGNTLFLLDYDLGQGTHTGIEIAQIHGIIERSVLVTGHFDDPTVLNMCQKLGLKLLPKTLIESMPAVV